jgi:DNA mismatch repair protein MLH3
VEVIEQVDRKFIACRIAKQIPHSLEDPSLLEGILVLVDQHAADERIRVERLLKELCLGFLGTTTPGVEVRELVPPRPVLLTQHEFLSIMGSQDIRDSLRKWGVQVVVPKKNSESGHTSDPGSSGYVQIHVKTVPEIVGEKVGATSSLSAFVDFSMDMFQFLQGDELRDFIKGFLGQIQSGELFTDSGLDLLSEADRGEFAWLKVVRHCPKGLLELINSKACRGK